MNAKSLFYFTLLSIICFFAFLWFSQTLNCRQPDMFIDERSASNSSVTGLHYMFSRKIHPETERLFDFVFSLGIV